MLMAVMDLGSNSFKMTVAQWAPQISRAKPFRILHKERHPIQLGASVFSEGEISEKDFKAALKVLERMQARLRDFSSPMLRIVATSAIRDAANGKAFVATAHDELGLPIEVISGSTEARLIAHGLSAEYPKVERGLLIDIGGGSTEVASFGKGWDKDVCHSFRMGSVRLAMQSGYGDKKLDLEKMRRHLSQLISKQEAPREIQRLVGSAGTIQSLGLILGGAAKTKHIKKSALDAWIEENLEKTPKELVDTYGLQPSRARVVVPGAAVLSEILNWLGQAELVVTEMSLRDGVMVDLVKTWRARENQILNKPQLHAPERELLAYLENKVQYFHCDPVVAANTAALALTIFDGMKESGYAFTDQDRRCLLAASYLHDVGKSIAKQGHHRHTSYILKNLEMPGISNGERKVTALVALYHRKDPPPKKDPLPFDVDGGAADRVRKLSAILRLADGLNKGQSYNTWSLRFRALKKRVFLQLFQSYPEPVQLEYFRGKAKYFEEIFGLEVSCFVHHKPRGGKKTSGGSSQERQKLR